MNKLIHGKNNLDRIVNVEIVDDQVELYREMPDGSLDIQYLPNKYWILSPFPVDKSWFRLKGNLYYKYGKQFTTKKDYFQCKNFLKGQDTFSIYNSQESAMVKDGFTYYKNMKPDEVSVLSFDIETTGFCDQGNSLLLISNTFRKNGKITKALFAYDDYVDEGTMIQSWCDWATTMNPSIILGHNVNGFDFPFLQEVADRENVPIELGRDGSAIKFDTWESKFRKDGSQEYSYKKVHIFGREIIDTMFLAMKYDIGRKYTSYGLKSIIKEEGLEKKDRVFYDAQQIKNNYKDPVEWEKIKEYCKDDSDDALALFDLMASPFFYLAQSVPKTFQAINEGATGSQLNAMMIRSYLQEGHSLPKASDKQDFEGAISFGKSGIFKDVWKVDVASLYPSIMLQYEIFDKVKDPNGNLLQILNIFTTERLKNKKLAKETNEKYYDDLQNAQKIVINSLYGFMGAPGLLFNFPDGAASVTRHGRHVLQTAINWAKERSFDVINGDTDSISITMNKYLTEEERLDLLNKLNSQYPERIHFEDDGYYDTFIVWGGKNYALWDGKKLKLKGSSIKSSQREAALKDLMTEVIQSIIDEKFDYLNIYNKYILRCLNITTKEEMKLWSSKKTVTDKVLTNTRTNESKIRDAIGEMTVQEGDKIYIYFKQDGTLSLVDNFNQDHDPYKLMQKVWNAISSFEDILDVKQFEKYHLKTKRKHLDNILKVG